MIEMLLKMMGGINPPQASSPPNPSMANYPSDGFSQAFGNNGQSGSGTNLFNGDNNFIPLLLSLLSKGGSPLSSLTQSLSNKNGGSDDLPDEEILL